jgi:CheY-like chemotaxis protein
LTRRLLAFSRRQIISPKAVDPNNIIKRMEGLLFRVIGEDIELQTILVPGVLKVIADPGQIEQVLMNLAANARDAMPDGGTLTVTTEVVDLDSEFIKMHGYGKVGRYVLIVIQDTGHGMDEKTRERIFEPFFTTKEVGRGTGLGLAMVYGIVKQHEGYINVYSETGKGTAFKIYLPVIKSAVEEEELPLPDSLPKRGTETILIAEDDAGVRKITRDILERAGYTVIEAVDGQEAVDIFILNKDRIHLLLIDVIMPRKSGKDVYEEIKKIEPEIKMLFISGYTANTVHRKGVLEEGKHFIQKPILSDNLLKKIRAVLDQ